MREAQPRTWKHLDDSPAGERPRPWREQRLPLPACAALALLENSAAAVLMLREDGSIAWNNRRATELIGDPVDLRFRFLRDHPAVMRIAGRFGESLVVTTRPLELRSDDGSRGEVLIMAIAVAEAGDTCPSPELLESLYGLTRAEARVAIEITRGKTISQIACEQHVAPSTVRSPLKSAFAKMGVGRQPELVRRVLSLATLPLA